jgi:glycosyltransferase involved in cell wall biosynthesis
MRCVLAQTFTDWELLLIDDGSTDDGPSIVRQIGDPRVQVYSDGRNKGMAVRYNQITACAKGEFIARFDADDLCAPQRFEKQVDFLTSRPDVDVVSTHMLCLDEKDRVVARTKIPTMHKEIFRNPFQKVLFHHGPLMGRTSWFRKFPYSEKYRLAVDYALYFDSYQDSKYAAIPEPLYFYREHATHSFKKYFRTNLCYSKIIAENQQQPSSVTYKLKARYARYLRVGIYGFACALGFDKQLIRRRHLKPASEDFQEFERAMSVIKAVSVPGIDM